MFSDANKTYNFIFENVGEEHKISEFSGEPLCFHSVNSFMNKIKKKKLCQVYTSEEKPVEYPIDFNPTLLRNQYKYLPSFLMRDNLLVQLTENDFEIRMSLKNSQTGKVVFSYLLSHSVKAERVSNFVVVSCYP